jgi:hypothetical protein
VILVAVLGVLFFVTWLLGWHKSWGNKYTWSIIIVSFIAVFTIYHLVHVSIVLIVRRREIGKVEGMDDVVFCDALALSNEQDIVLAKKLREYFAIKLGVHKAKLHPSDELSDLLYPVAAIEHDNPGLLDYLDLKIVMSEFGCGLTEDVAIEESINLMNISTIGGKINYLIELYNKNCG